ncbi:MAG: restriction endonuclease [Rhodospirillaceae bacterium]|nr:MAG: restriction endonuclease [Rhodospirillaceae bacterium]
MPDTNDPAVPIYEHLMWPTLKAIEHLGGSATNAEILSKVIEIENISDQVQTIQHINGRQSKLDYNLAWARTYLKKGHAINNSEVGVWSVTDLGEKLKKSGVAEIFSQIKYKRHPFNKRSSSTELFLLNDTSSLFDTAPEDDNWRDTLLKVVKSIEPSAFERLSQRILRESGFKSVKVTGRSKDGGIDGIGILQINLITFSIAFQCKRYEGSVSSPQIRDFRGALDGKCEKGLFITTGSFTAEAEKEANRDGAKNIDLVNGERLCDLLKELSLGVSTQIIEEVSVDEKWFKQI